MPQVSVKFNNIFRPCKIIVTICIML
jgi:hypothetical protein